MNSRAKNALITLLIGLVLNVALGVSKLVVGILAKSTSVASDAVNNLSDAAVSVVSVIAVALSARAADHDHPYGHGRYEYIATFILGAVIAAVGIEVMIDGIERAIRPETVLSGAAVWATLGASIGVKAFMAVFYALRGKKTKNGTIKAAAVDSVSDAAVTSAVLVCMIIEKFTGAHIDGYASIAVSVVILVFAVRILKNVIGRLLGGRPDPQLTEKVNGILSESEHALSSHDLVINDYGETHKIAEVDVVFPAELTFVEVHAECDRLERRVEEETGVHLSIHADPLITDDERLVKIGELLSSALSAFNATAHDLGIDDCSKVVELDISLPDDKTPANEIRAIVEAQVRQVLPYAVKIHTDYI
ncbi:MAG: cation diffusion facilitator family transporter [Clostridiales bacterium]|nr:cation diffusion facilitator family transporter [Clostridiales bacterium]